MSETLKNCNSWIMFTLGAILVVVLALFLRGANPALGDSPGSVPANNSSTTDFTIGTSVVRIYSTSSCAARIITVKNPTGGAIGGVNLTFSENTSYRPTATLGQNQTATSTVAYGGENFGCGTGNAISATGANVSVSVTETW